MQDHGQQIGVDTFHHRAIIVSQAILDNEPPKRIQDTVADFFKAAVSDIASDPNDIQVGLITEHVEHPSWQMAIRPKSDSMVELFLTLLLLFRARH
jgi:hypothetical protein